MDFGTSTSVIRVKRYQDGEPIGNRLETKPVTFNMGSTMVPTLIQKLKTGESYLGYEAENAHRGSSTYPNFKVDIENPDDDIRRQVRELTSEYFCYLAKTYKIQSDGGHLGQSDDQERTIISYPVKWSSETKDFMIGIAKAAGFPNVEGIDEAQAAIQAVTIQNDGLLAGKGYFQYGVPVHILLIDMGAGTTDLVLCRHTPGDQPKTEILSIWPKEGNALFGGREVDELLKGFISRALPEEDADVVLKKIGIEKYKAWKESMVSPALQRGEAVDYFAALDDLLSLLEIDAEYSIDRDSFESFAEDYLCEFPRLVNGCVDAAGISGDDVDLIILTGGHSQWYFVQEMLSGTMSQFGKVDLGKIHSDPDRIVCIALPQETVALGLAYGPLRVDVQSLEEDDAKRQKLEELLEVLKKLSEAKMKEIDEPAVAEHMPIAPQVPYTPENEFKLGGIFRDEKNCIIVDYIGNASVVKIPEFINIKGMNRKVVEIAPTAFRANKKIETVIIPESVKKIPSHAFEYCTNLKTVVAHDKIEEIDSHAFRGCDKLETIDFGMGECTVHTARFPANIKSIWWDAFRRDDGKSIFKNVMLSKYTDIYDFPLLLNREIRKGPQAAFGNNCTITYYDK